jgi:hypothetical protein
MGLGTRLAYKPKPARSKNNSWNAVNSEIYIIVLQEQSSERDLPRN